MIYGGIDNNYSDFDKASVLIQPVPYDGTSTWGKGADEGFKAFIEASENMELYEIETNSEVYKKGIAVLNAITEDSSPESMTNAVFENTKNLLKSGKFITHFGGEHSISIGVIKAFAEKHKNLSVLQLDAHADLRESYLGSECNHACALHWASKNTNLVQIGIRSMDVSEKQYMNYDKCFFAEEIYGKSDWMQKSIDLLGDHVYLTIDLDVFDPAIMPATGTPEPGGLDWNTTINYLRKVFETKNVVGFDIVELAPIKGFKSPEFLVSKLFYKLISYKFKYNG